MTPSLFFLCLFVAALAGSVVYVALPREQAGLRSRIAAFVELQQAPAENAVRRGRRRRLGEKGLHASERLLERTTWWHRLKEEVEIAEFPLPPLPYVLGTVATTVVLAVMLAFFSVVAALLALFLPLLARAPVTHMLQLKRERFAEQLPDSLLVLASSLRAGHSFSSGLQAVVDEASDPSRGELKRAVADVKLGVSLEDSLLRVARRMKNGDLEQIAIVASLQQDTGGNTAEVLDTVIETIHERYAMRRLVRTLTAEGRMAQWILTALPVAVAAVIALINPSYLAPLFTTGAGQVMLAISAGLILLGFLSIKRIVSMEI